MTYDYVNMPFGGHLNRETNREALDRKLKEQADRNERVNKNKRIEKLEAENTRLVAIIKEDNAFLAGYHKWCQMHGCAPSSSDLLIAIEALKEEKKDGI
jgi:hypothetical protein